MPYETARAGVSIVTVNNLITTAIDDRASENEVGRAGGYLLTDFQAAPGGSITSPAGEKGEYFSIVDKGMIDGTLYPALTAFEFSDDSAGGDPSKYSINVFMTRLLRSTYITSPVIDTNNEFVNVPTLISAPAFDPAAPTDINVLVSHSNVSGLSISLAATMNGTEIYPAVTKPTTGATITSFTIPAAVVATLLPPTDFRAREESIGIISEWLVTPATYSASIFLSVPPTVDERSTNSFGVDWAFNVSTIGTLFYRVKGSSTWIERISNSVSYDQHSQSVPGSEGTAILPDTTYEIYVEGDDGGGNVSVSAVYEVMTLAPSGDIWLPEELHSYPESGPWSVIANEQTMYVDENWEARTTKDSSHPFIIPRVGLFSIDNKPAFANIVKQNDEVQPLGIDSDYLAADFSTFTQVLFRYRTYVERHSGHKGKWISFHLGRGMIGAAGFGKSIGQDGIDWGPGGAGINIMHPERNDNANYIRILASEAGMETAFGKTTTGSGSNGNNATMPIGQWVTVDTIIEKDVGYRVYEDGVLKVRKHGINPVMAWNGNTGVSHTWESNKRIWMRIRCMHGGTPPDLLSYWDYREFYGGLVIATK